MRIKMQQSTQEKKLGEAFKEFIKYCRVKNLSDATISYYEEGFETFIGYYPESNYTKSVEKYVVDDYILYLRDNTNLNNISINSRLRSVRAIFYYFMKIGYTSEFKIELVKADKKIKETYIDKELRLLLKKPNIKTCIFTEYRDYVIINYLLATGNRASTLINLKIKDIDFDNNLIKLEKTKNKKEQLIPLSNTLSNVLIEYLRYRDGKEEEFLFCSIYGYKLTINALEHSIKKYNQRRGVMKSSIHLFRHTFAKKWILSGGDIFRLQKMLGHSSMEIVKEYVNMFSDDLKVDFDKFNPLEQLQSHKTSIKMRN